MVKSLMPGSTEILDPVSVFLNYVEASSNESDWFNFEDQGILAIERALAIYNLYQKVILTELAVLVKDNCIEGYVLKILYEKFRITLES